jgi:hypothetical protein
VWFHVFRLLVKCCVQGFEWAFLVWIWSTIEDFKAIDRDKEEGESTTDSLVSNCVKLFIRISAAKFVSTCNRFFLQHLFGLLLMVVLRMRMRGFWCRFGPQFRIRGERQGGKGERRINSSRGCWGNRRLRSRQWRFEENGSRK